MKNVAFFPMNVVRLTQGFGSSSYSHQLRMPIDFGGYEADSLAFAPCDVKVVAIDTSYNTVVFESLEKIVFSNGEYDYVNFQFTHCNDLSEFNIYVGKTFNQFENCYREGVKSPQSNMTGSHIHFEVRKGKFTKLYDSNNVINPCDVLFIKDDTDIVVNTYQGVVYHFKTYNDNIVIPDENTPNVDYVYYVVVRGDTLTKISNKFGVSINDIAILNGIVDINKIYVNQKLKIKSISSSEFYVGDKVIVNGYLYVDSYGGGKGKQLVNYNGSITIKTDLSRKTPYHIDSIGWVNSESITRQ